MKIYNPLTDQLETFTPQRDFVSVYVCGITPYDTTHLGHAFTYNVSDILIRYLEYKGHTVRYVQNVTDIDDDILRKANEVGEDWLEVGNRWTRHFIEDLRNLNVRPPDHFPRATEVIAEIIETVSQLIEKGVAYEKNSSVYFSVDAWESFGELSKMNKAQMLPIANERGNNPDDPNKRDPLDFVLWQAHQPGEPSWDSPWGAGRPGWHIECSTMSTKFLGDTIDFHGGGSDLKFPHHECEIAQVEPVTGKRPFVRFWMHAAMVRHEGEKMSKSLGNLVMARNLLQEHTPDALRLYLAMHHYQIEWACDRGRLRWAERLTERLTTAATAPGGSGAALETAAYQAEFEAAMDNNLDTPTALGVLDELAVQTLLASQQGQDVREAQTLVRAFSKVFGLRLDAAQPEPRVIEGWTRHIQKFE